MATVTDSRTDASRKVFLHSAIVIVVGVLATTLAQTQTLARIPLQNLLKNELHVDRTANAAFFFWIGLAWYFKPFAGIITDAFPLWGSRRKSYILIGTVFATLWWIALAFTPHKYGALLGVCIGINAFMVVASTVVGGYMVETAQAMSGSGRLTAIRQFVQQFCAIIFGPAGGMLAAIAFGWTALACGGVMFLLVPATVWFLHEQRRRVEARQLLHNAGRQLVKIGTARTMWAAAGLMALFYIAPGLSTAIFYRQQNELHLSTSTQGYLQFLGGFAGMLAAAGYAWLCRRVNLRTLLVWCLVMGMLANLAYLWYSSFLRAQLIDGFNGFGYTLAELVLMDLAIRATPAGSEGLGFSLMMSVRNLALFGTDWFGSKLLDDYGFRFSTLVITNSLTTFLTVPLVFWLPKALINKTDA
jgi:MFS family permease